MTTPNPENNARTRMTSKQRRRSIIFAQIGAVHALIGITCIAGGVMTLVALKLGAGEIFIGFLSSITLGGWALRIFTMNAVEKYGKLKVLIFWKSISTLCIIPFFFLPWMADRYSPAACLTMILIASLVRMAAYSFGNTGWFPILHDIVPRQITGRFFATIRTSWQSTRLVTLLLVAWFLGKNSAWWKFEVLFIVAFIAYAIRVATLFGMVESPMPPDRPKKLSILKRFRQVLEQKSLRRLVLYITVYMVAAIMAEPFKIKFLKDLGYSDGFILAATAMVSLGAIISLRFWGKLADRFGNVPIFSISHVGMPLATIPWILVGENSGPLVLALFFLWSVFFSGNGIAQTRYILHAVEPSRQNQINVVNIIANFAMGIAPLLAGVFLKLTAGFGFKMTLLPAGTFNNYHLLFVISAALYIWPHILHRKLGQSKDTPAMQVLAIVTRPILSMFGPFIRTGTEKPPQKPTKES